MESAITKPRLGGGAAATNPFRIAGKLGRAGAACVDCAPREGLWVPRRVRDHPGSMQTAKTRPGSTARIAALSGHVGGIEVRDGTTSSGAG